MMNRCARSTEAGVTRLEIELLDRLVIDKGEPVPPPCRRFFMALPARNFDSRWDRRSLDIGTEAETDSGVG